MTQATTQAGPTGTVASHKIQPRHHERRAVVYVRQSTLQQVERHRESTRIQYGLRDLAARLGWPEERIEVIDEDLGVSGASGEDRSGFQRLLADVALDRVGLILGVEMSRLARSCKDWYQLLELCSVFGTLIGDLDGLYDPAQYNDRLLLGLKGTMSEAELHVIKQRMEQGRLAKARRGELGRPVPIGYVRRPSGEVSLDPDEEVRAVVQRIFSEFERLGTAYGVVRFFAEQGLRVGVRVASGPNQGELEWRRLNRQTLTNLLKNPAYAGAYAYGRRVTDPRRKKGGRRGTGRVVAPRDEWVACVKDRHPAYITWADYERNVAQLQANRSVAAEPGAPRKGAALLAGRVFCGLCGARLATRYQKRGSPRYECRRELDDYGGSTCQGLPARVVDAEVSRLALQALAPSALDVSLRVGEDIERARAEKEAGWRRRLERARYAAERAARQYHAVEPENRLVARTLETAWEEQLRAQRELEEEYERSCREQPRMLTAQERAAIRDLADDLPALWNAPTTTVADRKAILALIVERVVVTVEGKTEWMEMRVHWAGGRQTYRRLRRPVKSTRQLADFAELRERLRALKDEELNAPQIADRLNAEGWRRPKAGARFTGRVVRRLLSLTGLAAARRRGDRDELGPDEWWLPELARELGRKVDTVYKWVYRGHMRARQLPGPGRRWVLTVGADELEKLRKRPPSRLSRLSKEGHREW